MEEITFTTLVGAVLAGNALTGIYVWFLYEFRKQPDLSKLPTKTLAAGVAPPLLMALGAYWAM